MAKKPQRSAPGLSPLPAGLPRVPRAIMRSSREPLDAQLDVKRGHLPDDLQGHVFVMAPVGSVEDGCESQPGNPILSGEGMIYRVDFDRPGQAFVKAEPSTAPCYYADRATYHARPEKYAMLRFRDFGLGRLSPLLGMRNLLNTAFLPMRFGPGQRPRLVITTDDGRPYEIDPQTLRTVTPVGRLTEWRNVLGNGIRIGPWTFGSMPFPLIMSTAHPVFDPRTSEMFTVNYGRAQSSMVAAMTQIAQSVDSLSDALLLLLQKAPKLLMLYAMILPVWFFGLFRRKFHGADTDSFTYLLRWRGDGDLERWNLVLPDGSPVVIEQTLHQMAITRDYIVLLDASFKFAPDQMYNSIHPFHRDNQQLERMIREMLTGPQMPETKLYIVRRSDLQGGQQPRTLFPRVQDPPSVVAKQLTIEPEALHFLADYENPDQKITLHVVHSSAACLAEWLRDYDQSAYPPYGPVPHDLLGLIAVGQMDISRLGRYVVDGEHGVISESHQLSSVDNPNTFNVAFYAYRDAMDRPEPPAQLKQIYWMTGGFWPELLTKFIYDMYRDYRSRAIPIADFQQMTGNFKPTALLRLDTEKMQLVQSYEFPPTHLGLSPQFVPRRRDAAPDPDVDPYTDGYLVCTVVSEVDGSEFWIFKACDLTEPVCVLGHAGMKFGMTIHNTWLPEAPRRDAPYYVSAREDFEPRVKATRNFTIAKLFERDVYPYCDRPGAEP